MEYTYVVAAHGIYVPQKLAALPSLGWKGKTARGEALNSINRLIWDVIEAAYNVDENGDVWRLTANDEGDILAYNSSAINRLANRVVRVCLDCYEALIADGNPEHNMPGWDHACEASTVPDELKWLKNELSDDSFSWATCDTCNSSLGGARFAIIPAPRWVSRRAVSRR